MPSCTGPSPWLEMLQVSDWVGAWPSGGVDVVVSGELLGSLVVVGSVEELEPLPQAVRTIAPRSIKTRGNKRDDRKNRGFTMIKSLPVAEGLGF